MDLFRGSSPLTQKIIMTSMGPISISCAIHGFNSFSSVIQDLWFFLRHKGVQPRKKYKIVGIAEDFGLLTKYVKYSTKPPLCEPSKEPMYITKSSRRYSIFTSVGDELSLYDDG